MQTTPDLYLELRIVQSFKSDANEKQDLYILVGGLFQNYHEDITKRSQPCRVNKVSLIHWFDSGTILGPDFDLCIHSVLKVKSRVCLPQH